VGAYADDYKKYNVRSRRPIIPELR
jgi:hypothetical protein